MATVVAVPFVVKEDDAEISVWTDGFGQITAVHVRVAARFEHQGTANVVGVFLQPRPPLDDGIARKARQTTGNDAECFTTSVNFNGRDGASDFHVCFMKPVSVVLPLFAVRNR